MTKVKRQRSKEKQMRISDIEYRTSNIGLSLSPFIIIFVCILALLLFIVAGKGVAFAQAKAEPKKPEAAKPEAKKAEPTAPKFNVGDFTYTSANRRDPFEAVSLSNLKETGKGASSKRGYELEELKLVGIMRAGSTNIAMMEDMKGRGLLFKKNDYLNKNLWIVNILADKVEFGYKIKGEIKTFTIDIPRKKEGM